MDHRNYPPPNAWSLRGEPPEFDDGRRNIRRAGAHPEEELMMEDPRIASQQRHIETLYHENERLAISCFGLKRELAAANQEKLNAQRTELVAQMKEIGDDMMRILPEVKQSQAIKAEIGTVQNEVQRGRHLLCTHGASELSTAKCIEAPGR
nr:protein FLC EXPRESSOR-like [Ipomoea batatas]